jgi:CheY-like chemotaxis protein
VIAEWYDAARSGREFAGLYRFLMPDGRVLWIEGAARAIVGADVLLVDNGLAVLEAIDTAAANGAGYDIILMDMQRPILDGYQAASALRARGYRGPVLALTAHAMAADLEQCTRAGCDEVITKPIDRATFLAALGRHFARRAEAPPPTSQRRDCRSVVRLRAAPPATA